MHCGAKSYCCDAFQFLMLSFPSSRSSSEAEESLPSPAAAPADGNDDAVSLESLIATYFAEETLGVKVEIKCEPCKVVRPVQKSVAVSRAPSNLIICLKRFRSNNYGQLIAKNGTPVSIPFQLDLSPYMTRGSASDATAARSAAAAAPQRQHHLRTSSGQLHRSSSASDNDTADGSTQSDPFADPRPSAQRAGCYQLYAVVHHGGNVSSGHYYATCLCRRKWYVFNDSSVREQDADWLEHAASSAYLLLFKRT
jgi:ubiquitin C-terminal hydrolase